MTDSFLRTAHYRGGDDAPARLIIDAPPGLDEALSAIPVAPAWLRLLVLATVTAALWAALVLGVSWAFAA